MLPASTNSVLTWEKVEPVAKVAFNLWVDQPELVWAKRAWDYIIRYGFAKYSDATEKTQVYFRFLAVCSLYRDWSHIMWDEYDAQDEFDEWALLLGMTLEEVSSISCSEEEFIDGSIRFLSDVIRMILKARVDEHRAEVVQVLLTGFGGESGLFVSLYRSRFSGEASPKLCGSSQSTDEEILETNFYSDGWKWICDGCTIWPRDCAYDR